MKLKAEIHIVHSGLYKGYQYSVIKNPFGYYCGYVEISPAETGIISYVQENSHCHGGITFCDYHTMINNKFVLGFDCMHAGDKTDMLDGIERDLSFVITQCYLIIDEILYCFSNPEILI